MTKGKRYWVVKLEKLANGQDLADVELVAMHRLREKARRSSLLRRTFGHDPFIVRVPIFAALAGISLLLLWPVVDRIAAPFGGFFGSTFWG